MQPSFALVVSLQLIVWSVVGCLLFYRGVNHLLMVNIAASADSTGQSKDTDSFGENITDSQNLTRNRPPPVQKPTYSSGIVMIVISCLMFLVGTVFIIIKLVQNCMDKRKFSMLPQDLPPKYEEVVAAERAPSYSTLFETHSSSGVRSYRD